ncbi:hypothetical protein [Geodermatophilus sp. SYSU D00766]
MDLLAIMASLWRHRLLTAVMVTLTVAGALSVLTLAPREYNAHASYVLVNPLPQPTQSEVVEDPSLAEINWDNPYLRFASEGTVGQVLAGRMNGNGVRQAMVGAGADGDYSVAQSPTSLQILDVVGTGTSAQEAEHTLELVSQRMQDELHAMQKVNGADDRTLITILPVAAPTAAHVVISGTIRTLVGVIAAGVLVLFAGISLAEARRRGPDAPADPLTARAARGRRTGRGSPPAHANAPGALDDVSWPSVTEPVGDGGSPRATVDRPQAEDQTVRI